MVIKSFPPIEFADENGILAVGGDLDPESLLLAYKSGIFPWPHSGYPMLWFCPPKRAILFLKDLHIPKSLKKEQKKTTFKFTINTAFQDVINQCALSDKRSTGPGTWITPQMIESYTKLHKKGFVYSVETWDDKELVGGFYGVHIGNMWAGESMFYLKPNASKLAFLFFAENLKEKGIEWIDCQQLTDTFKNFGAKLIDRSEFLKILSITIK